MRKSSLSFIGGTLLILALCLTTQPLHAQYHVKTWNSSDYPYKLTTVLNIAQDDEGFIWIATDGKGVLRFDGITFRQYTAENTPAFHSNSINKLLFDQEGALWFASKGGGITKYEDGSFSRPLQRFEDVNQIMLTLAETPDGAMWFGSDGGGLYRLKDDSLQNFTTSNSNIPYNNVFSLAEFNGKLLAGLYKAAVEIDYDSELTFTPIDPISDVTLSINIIDDYAWLGTGSGLYKYDGSSIENYQTGGDRYASHITDLTKDASGNMWATTYNGLFKFNPQEGSFSLNKFYDDRWPYFTIFEDANNNLWLPPVGLGLSRIRPTVFAKFLEKDELPGSIISVQELEAGNFVISSSEGLFRYRNGRTTLLSDEIPSTSPLLVDSKKRLWVGFRNGGLARYQNGALQTTGINNPSVNALYESSDESI